VASWLSQQHNIIGNTKRREDLCIEATRAEGAVQIREALALHTDIWGQYVVADLEERMVVGTNTDKAPEKTFSAALCYLQCNWNNMQSCFMQH
jgi:hypothetical protein